MLFYIKGSEEIADILGYMGAAQGAFELFSVQIEKKCVTKSTDV